MARQADVDPEILIKLIAGETTADMTALIALERAMCLPEGDLQREPQSANDECSHLDPLRCYTVKQVAERMGVSPDTVRSEMETGALGSITVGQRAKRIPHEAFEHRLSQWRNSVRG